MSFVYKRLYITASDFLGDVLHISNPVFRSVPETAAVGIPIDISLIGLIIAAWIGWNYLDYH
jgi:hypothetical protein